MLRTSGRNGQAMILTTLALGGVILGATVIAGTLMLYQIRATTNAENSAKAIFAADAGTQWALFEYYSGADVTPLRFEQGGASVLTTCYDVNGSTTDCADASNTVSAIAIGSAVDAERAFYLTFSSAVEP